MGELTERDYLPLRLALRLGRAAFAVTFAAMAATIAVLTLAYGAIVVLLTYRLAERMRAQPRIARALEKLAGVFLIGFGIKLAVSK